MQYNTLPSSILQPGMSRTTQSTHTIIVKNLHENATQEIVFSELKSLRIEPKSIRVNKVQKNKLSQGFLTFESQQARDDAFNALQFQSIFQNIVTCANYNSKKENNKKNRIFLKNINQNADPKKIYQRLTQLGQISDISIYLDKNKKPVGTGFVQLLKDEDFNNQKKKLDAQEEVIPKSEYPELNFTLEIYEKKPDEKQMCRVIIYDIKSVEEQDNSKFQAIATQKSQQIKNDFKAKGIELEDVIYNIQKGSKDQAIITFKDQQEAKKFISNYDEKNAEVIDLLKYIAQNEEIPQVKVKFDQYKDYTALYLNYLLPKNVPEGQTPEQYIEATLRQSVENIINVKDTISGITVTKGKKPIDETSRNFPDSYFALIFLKRGEFGVKFIQTYTKNKNEEFVNLFFNQKPNCTILITAAERRQMKRNKVNFTKELVNTQQTQQMGYRNGLPSIPMINQMNQNYQRQIKAAYSNNQREAPIQQQKAPLQSQGQASIAQFSNLESIQANHDAFIKLEQQQQFQHLGTIFYPRVLKALQEKEPGLEKHAQKITGMMVDLENFDLAEIFESLEDKAEFDERLSEALELIKDSEQ